MLISITNLHNLLPTGENLLKWKKIDDAICVYCEQDIHDLKHMLWDCASLHDTWKVISEVTDYVLDFKMIILGVNKLPHVNRIISLLCYLIFKKYLIDKDRNNHNFTPVNIYIKYELIFRLKIYETLSLPWKQVELIQTIIQNLS